ncbi:MAG: hypothetical protein ACXABY_11920 [Candidatus Thorarchaeota archaeon]
MIIPEFTKQPYEDFFIDANFEDVIDTDAENIVLGSSSVTAVNISGDEDVTVFDDATLVVQSLTKLAVRIKAGIEAKSPYKFTFKIVTSLNNKWEKDVFMKVEEF